MEKIFADDPSRTLKSWMIIQSLLDERKPTCSYARHCAAALRVCGSRNVASSVRAMSRGFVHGSTFTAISGHRGELMVDFNSMVVLDVILVRSPRVLPLGVPFQRKLGPSSCSCARTSSEATPAGKGATYTPAPATAITQECGWIRSCSAQSNPHHPSPHPYRVSA